MEQYVKPCQTTSGCCDPAATASGGTLEKAHCLSFVGTLFTLVFTYFGFFLLAFATMWNADLVGKCKEIGVKYREIRAQV